MRGTPCPGFVPDGGSACGAVSVEEDVLHMRRIPWQTPHCVEKDGKLLLSETRQEWLDKAVRRREKLAE